MADAKKCDRCGKLFEPYIKSDERLNQNQYTGIMVRDVFVGKSSYNNDRYFDLCPECSERLPVVLGAMFLHNPLKDDF